MEDGLAREGALVRCNQDRAATERDVECSNARRAAVAVAAQVEEARRADLAAESARKLAAMRDRAGREEAAQAEAEIAARAASDAAYEAQWRDENGNPVETVKPAQPASRAPSFGSPLGTARQPMRDDTAFNVESLSQVPTRPELELAAVLPPVSEVGELEIEIEASAIAPAPFGSGETLRR